MKSNIFLGLLITFFLLTHSLSAQKIRIETKAGKKYIIHKVQEKETVFKISQLYKVTQEELVELNPEIATVLKTGTLVSIPMNDESDETEESDKSVLKSSNENVEAETELVEIKHTVKKGEWLSKIAKENNVEVEEIKKWNNLKGEKITPGQELIVGISTKKTKNKNLDTRTSNLSLNKTKTKNLKSSNQEENKKEEPTFIIHEVAKGESIAALKKKYGVSMQAIKDANNLKNDEIAIGQKLKIPTTQDNQTNPVANVQNNSNPTNNNNAGGDPFNPNNNSNPFNPANNNNVGGDPFNPNNNSNPFNPTNNNNVGGDPFNPNNKTLKSSADNNVGYFNQPATTQPINYVLKDKETIYNIQNTYNVRKTEIRYWNNMSPNDNNLIAGKSIKLYVPRKLQHIVRQGETAESIAQMYRLHDGDQVRIWNKIPKTGDVTPGQVLEIYQPTGPTPPVTYGQQTDVNVSNNFSPANNNLQSNNINNNVPSVISHTVKQNEYLYDISLIYGVDVKDLKEWNGLANYYIQPGQVLKIYRNGATPPVNPNLQNNNNSIGNQNTNPYNTNNSNPYNNNNPNNKNTNPYNTNTNNPYNTNTNTNNNNTLKNSNPFENPYNGLPNSGGNPFDFNNPYNNNTNNQNNLNRGGNNNTYNGQSSDYGGTNTSKYLNNTNEYKPNNTIGNPSATIEERGLATVFENVPNAKMFGCLHKTASIGTLIIVKNPKNGTSVVAEVIANINPISAKAGVVIELAPTVFQRLGGGNDKMIDVEISFQPKN